VPREWREYERTSGLEEVSLVMMSASMDEAAAFPQAYCHHVRIKCLKNFAHKMLVNLIKEGFPCF
jgi:hypothetical protein